MPEGRTNGYFEALSKFLAHVLRHAAGEKYRWLKIDSAGYVSWKSLLRLRRMRDEFKPTEADINYLVLTSTKERFGVIQSRDGELHLRALQGHSLTQIDDEATLERITAEELHRLPFLAVHGGYMLSLIHI